MCPDRTDTTLQRKKCRQSVSLYSNSVGWHFSAEFGGALIFFPSALSESDKVLSIHNSCNYPISCPSRASSSRGDSPGNQTFYTISARRLARLRSGFLRTSLADLPVPSASSYICPQGGHRRYSYRGHSLHPFMPMPGVHHWVKPTAEVADSPPASAYPKR